MKRYVVKRDDLHHNIRLILEKAAGKTVWGVIKGDGYGLGVVNMARELAGQGIDHFAVTDVSEVRALREAGFDCPVLMMSATAERDTLRQLLALDAIVQDYILLTLDDFYLEAAVKTQYVEEALAYITTHEDVAVMYFAPTKRRKGGTENFRCMGQYDPYRVNAQMALWNKKALRSLVRAHETPWEFEVYGSRRAAGSPYRFYTWNGDGEVVFKYDWGKLVRVHMWDRGQVKKIEECWGITLDLGGVELYDTYNPPKTKNPILLAKKVLRSVTQTLFHSKWKAPAN